jgi:hypothetical protein
VAALELPLCSQKLDEVEVGSVGSRKLGAVVVFCPVVGASVAEGLLASVMCIALMLAASLRHSKALLKVDWIALGATTSFA